VTLTAGDVTGVGGALIASPNFTGTPTAPTAANGTTTTQLATTAFVMNEIAAISAGVTSFNTRTGNVVLSLADVTTAGGAPIASPSFSGVPLAPTAAPNTNTTQIATTAFTTAAVAALAAASVSSFNTRVGAVTLTNNDISAAGGALINSPTFTGTPNAPTPPTLDNTTRIATTAYVTATVAAGYLPLTGGTLSNLTSGTGLTILGTASAGQQRLIQGQTAGNNRWAIQPGDGTAETGSNAGSNFQITRWSDAGAYIDTPFQIARASGNVQFSGAGYVQVIPSSGAPAIFLTGNAGNNRQIWGQTGTSARWEMLLGDSTAESGGNAGSNFQIQRYSDASALVDSPLSINRANGIVTMPNAVAVPAMDNIGRNLLHNSMFNIQQRGLGPWSPVTGTGGLYGPDRWIVSVNGDTSTYQLNAMADADRTQLGDEQSAYILQANVVPAATAGDFSFIQQKIENGRRLSNKGICVSFWVRGSVATTIGVRYTQSFGTGGSPSAPVYGSFTQIAVTTTFTRVFALLSVPSASGKVFGTNNDSYVSIDIFFNLTGTFGAAATVQLWGVQTEIVQPGQTQPSPLEKLDIRYDLANCQRFYQGANAFLGSYSAAAASFGYLMLFPVVMRASPSVVFSGTTYTNASGINTGGTAAYGFLPQATATAAGQAIFNTSWTASADL
jgi:hypothetical protein